MFKNGLILWHKSTWFLISHGFLPDGPITQELLDKAKAHWDLEDPLPRVNPMSRVWAGIGWREGTIHVVSQPGRHWTLKDVLAVVGPPEFVRTIEENIERYRSAA